MFIYIYPSYTILLYREDIDIKEFIDRDSASLHKHGQMQTQDDPIALFCRMKYLIYSI